MARLVTKQLSQKYGVDYEETFAPMKKIRSILIVLRMAAKYDLMLHPINVKIAGVLDEELNMQQTEEYVSADN